MRVLCISAEPPQYSLGGGNIRQAHLLCALARATETHLLVAGPYDEDGIPFARVTQIPWPPWPRVYNPTHRRVRDVMRALAPQPWAVVEHRNTRSALGAAFQSLDMGFDAICIEQDYLAPLIECRDGERWILTMTTVNSAKLRQERDVATRYRHRWLAAREAEKSRRFEASITSRYSRVIVTSEEDKARLPTTKADIVPNGVDCDRFRPSALPAEHRLVFIGSLNYGPNVDGAAWFCHEVLPAVRAADPDISLSIVGRAPTPEVRALGRLPGVELHADVADVAAHFASARLSVVPIRGGTGTRLKALEAMAAGRPVVGTRVGLEGLGLIPGRHAVFADSAEEMAAAVLRIVNDDDALMAIAREARRHVEEHFDWPRLGAAFVAAVIA